MKREVVGARSPTEDGAGEADAGVREATTGAREMAWGRRPREEEDKQGGGPGLSATQEEGGS